MSIRAKRRDLADEFENGARRCDVRSAFELAIEHSLLGVVRVGDVVSAMEKAGSTPLTVSQLSDELYRMFELGEICAYVNGGRYWYFYPPFSCDETGKPSCLSISKDDFPGVAGSGATEEN